LSLKAATHATDPTNVVPVVGSRHVCDSASLSTRAVAISAHVCVGQQDQAIRQERASGLADARVNHGSRCRATTRVQPGPARLRTTRVKHRTGFSTMWGQVAKVWLAPVARRRTRNTVYGYGIACARDVRPLAEGRSGKDSMLGRWVEITGRLESETSKDPDNLRELDVLSAKLVPVVPPRAAAATPARQPTPSAAAEPQPTASPALQSSAASAASTTAAPRSLPKTANPVPAIGLAGLLALAGSVILRAFRLRPRG
jgi:hypothetical protein